MNRYLFVSSATLPIVAFAASRNAMRDYVRAYLGIDTLPHHAVVRIAA